jgi:hypothetical protein
MKTYSSYFRQFLIHFSGRDPAAITRNEINLTPNFWLQFFDNVEEVGMIENKYTMDYQQSDIQFYTCRSLKYNSTEIKHIIK